jgi:hypothetical protein
MRVAQRLAARGNPLNFHVFSQNSGRQHVITQLYADRYFRAESIHEEVVLPLSVRTQPLLYPAPGTEVILTTDRVGKVILAACLTCIFVLLTMFFIMCCRVSHP